MHSQSSKCKSGSVECNIFVLSACACSPEDPEGPPAFHVLAVARSIVIMLGSTSLPSVACLRSSHCSLLVILVLLPCDKIHTGVSEMSAGSLHHVASYHSQYSNLGSDRAYVAVILL